jgi:hypothetical protein
MLKLPLHNFLRPECVLEVFVHEVRYVPVSVSRAFLTEITEVVTNCDQWNTQ